MLETLISSKTRIKLLLKFFLNSKATSYLRGLESEFGESSNAIRLELNRFENAGMLISSVKGNRKYFQANINHPLFQDTHNILLKYVGLDKIVDSVIQNVGNIKFAFIIGSFAEGVDGDIIDMVLVGDVNKNYLIVLIEKVEKLIHRKVRYVVYSEQEFTDVNWIENHPNALLLWES